MGKIRRYDIEELNGAINFVIDEKEAITVLTNPRTVLMLRDDYAALQTKLAESEQAYEALTGLLNKRFPQTGEDYKVEDVLRENGKLRDVLKEIDKYFDKSPWRYQGKMVNMVKAALRDLLFDWESNPWVWVLEFKRL